MRDSIADCAAREERERTISTARLRARTVRAARRAKMTERGRLIEDLVDRYTEAVKNDILLEFFSNLADELTTYRQVGRTLHFLVQKITRFEPCLDDVRTAIGNVIERLDNEGAFAVLEKFNVRKLKQLKPEQYADVIAVADKMLRDHIIAHLEELDAAKGGE